MQANKSLGLFWFRHDLRAQDNDALIQLASKCDQLLCCFVVDPRWSRPSHFQSAHMGKHRRRFLYQSLDELDRALGQRGQRLLVMEGLPVDVLSRLIGDYGVTHLAANQHPGVYERQQIRRLQQHHSDVNFLLGEGHTLWPAEKLPFELANLPKSFTPFRKGIETQIVPDLADPGTGELPPLPASAADLPLMTLPPSVERSHYPQMIGGAGAGQAQIRRYINEHGGVTTYKATRNGLDGWDFSSKLSPWLANGSISPRQVYWAIKQHEQSYGENDSTYWLFFELLWREYFQWYLYQHESRLFKFDGIQQRKPLTSFWPQRFARWCAGQTPYPIVNACMHQLNATGFMSNRGRQLVASCLVHEFNLDWRYGAAYFEQQLIDFDAAANWGNWQYLAGVGADPRGHRQFDLAKQTRLYDPDGQFVRQWQGEAVTAPLDDVDPSDWPIIRH